MISTGLETPYQPRNTADTVQFTQDIHFQKQVSYLHTHQKDTDNYFKCYLHTGPPGVSDGGT